MILNEHKKHSYITQPSYGNFCRNEWAVLGTHCSTIRTFANDIIKALSSLYKCAYADTHHTNENDTTTLPGSLASGSFIEYTDEINYHQLNYKSIDQFQFPRVFNEADLVIVNGNHHHAKAQVLVIDETKKDSLKKRLAQLTNVQLILLADNTNDIFDFVKDAIPSWQQLPVYKLNDTDKSIQFFINKMQHTKPLLNGLVMAGGKSMRLGYDKSLIQWHGKEQVYHIADVLKKWCSNVFISCRLDQQKEIDNNYNTLPDTFTGLGPYGAILSAFREQPDAAWLVTACDMPLLDAKTIEYLIQQRNPAAMATAFKSSYDSLPEPLITIWEPKSYPALLSLLSQGYTCPKKALKAFDVKILTPHDPDVLMNVNTSADIEKVKQIMQQKHTAQNAY